MCKEIRGLDVYWVGMLEVMVGAIVFGFLSDQFGRKTCFVFSLVAQVRVLFGVRRG